MSGQGPATSLDAAHDAILAALRARFGDKIAQYGAYDAWDEFEDTGIAALVTPALLLELEGCDFAGDTDPTGRLAVRCLWAVHCVLSAHTPRLQQTLPQIAAAVASVVLPPDRACQPRRGNLWGLVGAAEPPEAVSAQPGGFSPGLNGRDAWMLRWEQTFYVHEEIPL